MEQKKDDFVNILVTGVGGQGNVTFSRMIGETVINEYNYITIGETFGASQRGGSVISHLRLGMKRIYSPVIPLNKADIVIGLEPLETIRVLTQYGNNDVISVSNLWPLMPSGVLAGEADYPENTHIRETIKSLSKKSFVHNFTKSALETGHFLLANSMIAGLVSGLGLIKGLSKANYYAVLKNNYSKDVAKKNIEAFSKGAILC
ncbi:MAG: 2-oxoacid:acceptor oxidoreductase family protein [Thermodesulfobacteriota bacterium]